MRKVLILFAALMLAGCSILQSAYDDRAQRECEEEKHSPERLDC